MNSLGIVNNKTIGKKIDQNYDYAPLTQIGGDFHLDSYPMTVIRS